MMCSQNSVDWDGAGSQQEPGANHFGGSSNCKMVWLTVLTFKLASVVSPGKLCE